MTIAATGRSGGIGGRLPGTVTGLSTRLERPVAEMVAELELHRPEVLIHLAALTSVAACEADPARARALNVDGSVKWLRAAASVGVKRLAYVSTSHVFKPTRTAELLDPTRAPDATTSYGSSKAEAERRLLELGPELGVDIRIARVFSVIAADMRSGYLYPALIGRAERRDLSPLAGWANTRDFITTRDAARAIHQIAAGAGAVRVYHVCSGTPRTVKSLAEEVFAQYGFAEAEMAPLFAEPPGEPNFMISNPTEIECR